MLDLEQLKRDITKILSPITPASNSTKAEKDFLFKAQKTEASKKLPPYYCVYFLFVELLGYKNLGQFEKISWSIPIDYNGVAFLIEHRKFGLGIFAQNAESQETEADEIATRINRAVKKAQPFFEKLAEDAAKKSELNVINNSHKLFGRFTYFLNEFKDKIRSEKSKKNDDVLSQARENQDTAAVLNWLYSTNQSDDWLALAAIDAFFSWTEHVFIHLAVLNGKITTGQEVSDLAADDWSTKYKSAISLTEEKGNYYYSELKLVRDQIRNFIAHGAFGKDGEAFMFHSKAGAVPITLEDKKRNKKFSIKGTLVFKNEEAIKLIEEFIDFLWSGKRQPAKIYIQESELPLILTMVMDGQYQKAMESVDNMTELVDYLFAQQERAWNMDW